MRKERVEQRTAIEPSTVGTEDARGTVSSRIDAMQQRMLVRSAASRRRAFDAAARPAPAAPPAPTESSDEAAPNASAATPSKS